ncbi:MAG: hypothetical protein M1818_006303 [Claussenomyces sp. TS43310]|nr:MAG: hypothetical protein M1818_006303 [Claussenomyces sp. TS43310]
MPSHSLPQSQGRGRGTDIFHEDSAGEKMFPPLQPSFPPAGKMLLPPLQSRASVAGSFKGPDKNRTAHACEKCRKAKAKCSGGHPCDKCKNEGKECVYGDGKRDLERKTLSRLARDNVRLNRHNADLKDKLLFVCQMEGDNQLSGQDIVDVQTLVFHYKDSELDSSGSEGDSEGGESEASNGEDFASADVGSTGSIDNINEDPNRDETARAIGFMGKNSAITWVQRARKESEQNLGSGGKPMPTGSSNHYVESSYLARDSDFPTVDEELVNPFEIPTARVARALVNTYFEKVHPIFPVLIKNNFLRELEEFLQGTIEEVTEEQQNWLCLLNVIFAIGSRCSHVLGTEWRGDVRDHLIYIARSRRLGLDSRAIYKDPELNHTVNLCLFGIYFLCTEQINKAWTITGMAIRDAVALGFHVRSSTHDLTYVQKEMRIRLWWSIYSVERALNEISGRPSAIADRIISTPLPANLDDEELAQGVGEPPEEAPFLGASSPPELAKPILQQARATASASASPPVSSNGSPPYSAFNFPLHRLPLSSSTLFIYRVQLSIITHDILSQLYCAATVKAKWSQVQDIMRQIDHRLREWKLHLPAEYDFTALEFDATNGFASTRAGLALSFNSARMTLYRPCLCRIDGRIKNESNRSKSFNSRASSACVKAARAVIQALPFEDLKQICNIIPWWSTAHHIVQAASILALELAYRAEHVPFQAALLVDDSRKALRCLAHMAEQSVSARRGWEVMDGLLRVMAPKVGFDVSDFPSSAPTPQTWNYAKFSSSDYLAPIGHYEQSYAQPTSIDTDAWVTQHDYGMMPHQHLPDEMAPTFASGPGANVMQSYGGFDTSLHLSGHMMEAHDEFNPWEHIVFSGQAVYPSRTTGPPAAATTAGLVNGHWAISAAAPVQQGTFSAGEEIPNSANGTSAFGKFGG